jgi:hypothetical protein
MWDRQQLTTVQVSTACYKVSFPPPPFSPGGTLLCTVSGCHYTKSILSFYPRSLQHTGSHTGYCSLYPRPLSPFSLCLVHMYIYKMCWYTPEKELLPIVKYKERMKSQNWHTTTRIHRPVNAWSTEFIGSVYRWDEALLCQIYTTEVAISPVSEPATTPIVIHIGEIKGPIRVSVTYKPSRACTVTFQRITITQDSDTEQFVMLKYEIILENKNTYLCGQADQ